MLRPGLLAMALAALAAPAFAQGYKAPRTPLGQPDLQGTWSNATITPLTRPAKFGDRLVLTPQEAAALEQANRDQVARARRAQHRALAVGIGGSGDHRRGRGLP